MARLWRAYLPGIATLEGDEFSLGRDDSHHLTRVLRLHEGDRFSVFDGAGREWEATLLGSDGRLVRARREDELTGPGADPCLPVHLFQAQGRPERIDWLVQKAVEVGVAALTLVPMARVDAPAVSPRRLERWQRIAVEACKQSGRRVVPAVATAAQWPGQVPSGVQALLLDTDEQAPALGQMGPATRVWLAVGPASGLAPEERQRAAECGWRPVSLGRRILRSETAGVIGAALILHRAGELG